MLVRDTGHGYEKSDDNLDFLSQHRGLADLTSTKGFNGIMASLYRTISRIFGGFPKLGYHFGGPYGEDYSILGVRVGSAHFGKLPFWHMSIFGGGYASCVSRGMMA